MADKTLSEALSGGEWIKVKDLVGQVITLTGEYEVREGQHGQYVVFGAITADGDEVDVQGSETVLGQIRRLDKSGWLAKLPELKVVSFDTKFGNLGYKLEEA